MLGGGITNISIITTSSTILPLTPIERYQAGMNGCLIDRNFGFWLVHRDVRRRVARRQTAFFGIRNFLNPGAGNFQTQAGGVRIDAGASEVVTTDIRGVSRPRGSGMDIAALAKG